MRRLSIPDYILEHDRPPGELLTKITSIREGIERLFSDQPDASIIIPAFNEEDLILKTLSSLSKTETTLKVEIIVVNNNSSDRTSAWVQQSGAICINESQQGITPARNCGLKYARGKFILNADADTIYPPFWVDLMVSPLQNDLVGMVYGNHYFIAEQKSRLPYAIYEQGTDLVKWVNRKFKEEAVNVYGFNSAFRKADALSVHGFDHPPGTNEDGWLAVKLRDELNKRLYFQNNPNARVWTSNRRLKADGGLIKAAMKRLAKFSR